MLGATFLTNLMLLAGNFVAGLMTARVLGVEDRGALAACLAFGLLTSRIGVLGLDIALAVRCGREDEADRGLIARAMAVSLAVGLALLAAGAALLMAGGRLTLGQIGVLGTGVAAYALSGQLVEIAAGTLVAKGRFATYNLSRLAYGGLLVVILAVLALADVLTLERAVVTYAIASTLAAALMAGAVLTRGPGPPANGGSSRALGGVLATAGPFAAFNTLRSAELHVPAITLALLGDNGGLGLFAVAHAVAAMQLSWADATGRVLFAGAVASRADPDRMRDLLTAWRRNVVRSVAVGLAVALAGFLLIPVVYGAAFSPARWVCLAWAPVLTLVALNNMLEELIKGTERRRGLLARKAVQATVLVACVAAAAPAVGGIAAVMLAAVTAALVALALNGRLVANGFFGCRPGALVPTMADAADVVAGLMRFAAARATGLAHACRSAIARPAA